MRFHSESWCHFLPPEDGGIFDLNGPPPEADEPLVQKSRGAGSRAILCIIVAGKVAKVPRDPALLRISCCGKSPVEIAKCAHIVSEDSNMIVVHQAISDFESSVIGTRSK